jgi:sugar-specific transcriptional regulator TrmB
VGRPGTGLLELLTEHGVPEKAARIYLVACREGPQTASELARVAAVDRVEAYRVVKQLQAMGLLHSANGRPMRFGALPPEALVERWIRRHSERLERLERDKEKILTDWRENLVGLDEQDPRKFAVLEGQDTVNRFLRKRIGASRQEILWTAQGFSFAHQIDNGLDRTLKEAHARGVKVRIVGEITRANLSDAKHFQGFSDLRHAITPITNRAIVIDRSGVLVFVSGEDGLGRSEEERIAVWSTAPRFVGLAREYHKRLWTTAIRAEARLVELEDPDRAVLSVTANDESEAFQRVREIAALGMRASGVAELRLHLPTVIELLADQLGRQIAEEVDGATADAVAQSLVTYYQSHTIGRLAVVKQQPLTLRVTGCFACTPDSPELGRVLCPKMLRSAFETRLGSHWDVSKPDPTKHATKGCLFTVTSA